jgi:hypothetical protein
MSLEFRTQSGCPVQVEPMGDPKTRQILAYWLQLGPRTSGWSQMLVKEDIVAMIATLQSALEVEPSVPDVG